MSESLFAIFRSRFPADLSRAFIERPQGNAISYGDVIELSGRIANVLVDLGVKPGDRVAVQVEKSAEALMLYLGTLRAGAVFLPLNTAYTPAEIRYFLGDAEPALFVCRSELEAPMRELAKEVGVPHVETLGETGDGSLTALARAVTPGTFFAAPTRAEAMYQPEVAGRGAGATIVVREP
jgi:malonyl-CoA/methylmalonyl-CoA synthetase